MDEEQITLEAPSTPKTRRPPSRPPQLELRHRPPPVWPALVLQDEVQKAAELLEARPTSQLRVATWNVWFDQRCAHERQRALVYEVLQAAPDIVCLQEVLPAFADVVRGDDALKGIYSISPQSVGHYGCMMLVRRDLKPNFSERKLTSSMDRTLLWAECTDRCKGLLVMTTHLESLNTEKYRRRQLEEAAEVLQGCSLSILCGDFNFDATQTWGDWQRSAPQRKAHALENNVLREVLPSFVDTWAELRPDDAGYTFDGETNHVCCPDSGERMRYDRLMSQRGSGKGAALNPQRAELLGTDSIKGGTIEGVKPSDHYGVLVDFVVDC